MLLYNERLKVSFLKTLDKDSVLKLVRNMFLAIESFEAEFRKDVSKFNSDELNAAIPSISGVRNQSVAVILSYLRKYVQWCADNGEEVCEDIFQYEVDTSDKARQSFVKSPEHLLSILNFVFSSADDNTVEYIYRAYLWLAYIGLTENEAAHVMDYDVDLVHRFIRLGDDELPIYQEAVHDIRFACEAKSFLDCKNYQKRVIDRAYGHEILRTKVSKKTVEEALKTTFRQTVSRQLSNAVKRADDSADKPDPLSLSLSYNRVFLSGLFYTEYMYEISGSQPAFHSAVDKVYGSKEYRHSEFNMRKRKRAMRLGYMKDYESWKRAFDLR